VEVSAAAIQSARFTDGEGQPRTLGQFAGKTVVVNFWATWCTPCREEMPRFVELQDRYGARGLQFVGVAIDQADKVRAFADEIHLNYPSLIGGYGAIELSRTLGNGLGALPFTVVVDRSGAIVHTQLGPVKDAQLRSMIDQLL
jgi:thiol-disulfide isomerase/thioredoxin